MRCFLSIFVERFGKFSSCRYNLLEQDSLEDLDFCTKLYSDAKKLRDTFPDEIKEFNERFSSRLEEWHLLHPGKTNHGKIYANFITNAKGKNFIATIPILYQGDELISVDEAIEHMVHYLDIDSVFEKLVREKSYLLLEDDDEDFDEYSMAKSYLTNRDIITRHEVINHFINRIRKMEPKRQYIYLRCLTNMCHLLNHEIYLHNGKVVVTDHYVAGEVKLCENDFTRFSANPDSFFERIITEGNDEDLYKYYDLEEIEKEGKKHV